MKKDEVAFEDELLRPPHARGTTRVMSMCFVLLADAKPLAQRPLERALKEFPQLGALTWLSSSRAGTSAFSIGGREILAALMPLPVAEGEMNGLTSRSLSGFRGEWVSPDHRAHLVVVPQGTPTSNIEELTAYTRIVAAIVRATGALAVCWNESGATHHPEFVVNIAHSELPLPIWVGFSLSKNRSVHELLSMGMQQLGLPDLLLTTDSIEAGVLEFFYDLLGYIARRGTPLPEGDSVGRKQNERIKVRYIRSPIDAEQKVWSVTLPASRAAQPKKRAATKKRALGSGTRRSS